MRPPLRKHPLCPTTEAGFRAVTCHKRGAWARGGGAHEEYAELIVSMHEGDCSLRTRHAHRFPFANPTFATPPIPPSPSDAWPQRPIHAVGQRGLARCRRRAAVPRVLWQPKKAPGGGGVPPTPPPTQNGGGGPPPPSLAPKFWEDPILDPKNFLRRFAPIGGESTWYDTPWPQNPSKRFTGNTKNFLRKEVSID